MKFLQKVLAGILAKRVENLGDHEFFNRLIRLAQEDQEMKQTLIKLVKLPADARHASLSLLLAKLEQKGAPADLRKAIQSLQKQDVAEILERYLQRSK